MRRNVVLTGFMGTGKTTVGRELAALLGYGFVDTDEQIVQRNGRSVADIFREQGELFFRDQEAQIAQELAVQEGMVIATGGRLMLDPRNAEVLSQQGQVFCLTADPTEILARLENEADKRPLLAVSDPANRIQSLLYERAKVYGQFTAVTTSGKTPRQVADQIRTFMQSSSLPVHHPSGGYTVWVGHGLLPFLGDLARSQNKRLVIVTDEHVGKHYAPQTNDIITIPVGEQHKNLTTVAHIYQKLVALGADRQTTLVALGGGVVGDITGFVAATYMRGIDFVQCPTSLLAMVDASVGGKTGVDLPEGKNLVGAFKQPTAVIADLDTLKTLPPEEMAAGMAEVIKHGLILGGELWADLFQGQNLSWQNLVSRAIQVKIDIVQEDPFENGRRAVLNLGHTFAHAIEQVSRYAVRHGEAVAMGLVAAAHLSAQLELCDSVWQGKIEQVLQKALLPTRIPAYLSPDLLWQAMGRDKKKAGHLVRFVLMREAGEVFLSDEVTAKAVYRTLTAVQEI